MNYGRGLIKKKLVHQFVGKQNLLVRTRVIGISVAAYCSIYNENLFVTPFILAFIILFLPINIGIIRNIKKLMANGGNYHGDLNYLTLGVGVNAFLWGAMIWDVPFGADLRQLDVALLLLVAVSQCIIILSASLHRPALIATVIGSNLGSLPPFLNCLAETGPMYLVFYPPMQFVLLRFAYLYVRQARTEALLQLRTASLTRRLALSNKALIDAADRLKWQADHDALTLLRNRRAFEREVGPLLADGGEGACFAVLLVDLDHFKRVNDDFGHDVGDQVLRASGRIFDEWESEGRKRITARWGGEEFIAIVEVSGEGGIGPLIDDLHARFTRMVARGVWPEGLRVTTSIGVSAVTADVTLADAVRNADRALYEAKAAGRDRWCRAA